MVKNNNNDTNLYVPASVAMTEVCTHLVVGLHIGLWDSLRVTSQAVESANLLLLSRNGHSPSVAAFAHLLEVLRIPHLTMVHLF